VTRVRDRDEAGVGDCGGDLVGERGWCHRVVGADEDEGGNGHRGEARAGVGAGDERELLADGGGVAVASQLTQAEARARQAVIAASPALRQRERAKLASYEDALADGLVARGAKPPAARLLARAAVACADEAHQRWLADANPSRPGLAGRGREAFAELAAELAALGAG
jgi:hypothetical protein